ncbi:MAG: NFACT family protein [Nanobdellota archaeon]
MKKQLTALELYYLLAELDLEGAKVDQVYQQGKEELVFRFHKPGEGKRMIRIMLPGMMYLTKYKGKQPDTPPAFCHFLRKRLRNSRLRQAEQIRFERIVDFIFETKERKYHMIVELFSDGNVILCDEDYKIIFPLITQNWKERTIRGGIEYQHPKKDVNFREISRQEFADTLYSSDKESIVKGLAIDFGLGGTYAEELCSLAEIDKDLSEIDDSHIDKLYEAAGKIKQREKKGLVLNDDKIFPFNLSILDMSGAKEFESFNEALDETLTESKIEKEEKQVESKKEKELKKLRKIIENQEAKIEELKGKIDENQKKGEVIFHNYQEVQKIIDAINKAREELSWDEIKKKLKGHETIKQINAKDKKVTLELEDT